MKQSEYGRYEFENLKNKMTAKSDSSAKYTALPKIEGPKIEVTINQNYDTSAKNADSRSLDRPSFSPPQPPPYPTAPPCRQTSVWKERFSTKENLGLLRVSSAIAFLAIVLLIGGIWCHCKVPHFCPYRTALWTPFIFIIAAVIGIAAAKISSVNLYIANLVLAMVNIVTCAVGGLVCFRSWSLMGTYGFSVETRNQAFCTLGQYDSQRITYILRHLYKYDFDECLYNFKLGITINAIYVLLATFLTLLSFMSAFLCCKRICTSCKE